MSNTRSGAARCILTVRCNTSLAGPRNSGRLTPTVFALPFKSEGLVTGVMNDFSLKAPHQPCAPLKGTARLDRSAGARYGGREAFFCRENRRMTGIQFVTDEKGRRTAVLIDLRKHRAIWEDFWDGLVSESRRKGTGVPYAARRNKSTKNK